MLLCVCIIDTMRTIVCSGDVARTKCVNIYAPPPISQKYNDLGATTVGWGSSPNNKRRLAGEPFKCEGVGPMGRRSPRLCVVFHLCVSNSLTDGKSTHLCHRLPSTPILEYILVLFWVTASLF